MSTVQPPTEAPTFRDQKTGLIIFGIFQIVLGAFGVMMGLVMAVFMLVGPPTIQASQNGAADAQAMNQQMMLPGLFLYFLFGGGAIWLGIGSILARRWARALTVIISWLWLIMGVVAFIGFVFIAGPMMAESMAQQGQGKIPPGMIQVMQVMVGVFTFCFYILLPSVFLIFYQRASVLVTCQRRDPQTRWTDRCPMPVLALSIIMAFAAVSMLVHIFAYRCVIPLFGYLATGMVGAIVTVLIALILAYLAWGTYRLSMPAWWGSLLLLIIGSVNMAVVFLQANLMELYEKMGMPEAQLAIIQKSSFFELACRWGVWISLFWGVVWLGYLFYVRRYFTHDTAIIGSKQIVD